MRYDQRLIKLLFTLLLFLFSFSSIAKENSDKLSRYHFDKKNVSEVGQLLYHYLQQQQWQNAEILLPYYQQRPQHETLLVDYTKALLAQTKGNFLQAEFYYQQQLRQKADFIPAQTGLIQLYLHQQEYKKAQQQLYQLSHLPDLSETLNQSISYYQKQLSSYFKGQRFYQVSFFYDDNLNHAPYLSEKVMSQSAKGKVTRKGAKSIESTGIAHFFSFYQPYFINAKHTFSTYAYARYIDYFSYQNANFINLYTQLSYHYRQPRYRGSISPYYEIKSPRTEYEYQAWGLNAEIFFPINKMHTININGNYKIKKYREELINLNSEKYTYDINYHYNLNNNTKLVNQLNYQISRKKNTLLNYRQYGIKTGVYYLLTTNWSLSLFLHYQFKYFSDYNPLLNKKRKDNSVILTTNIKNKSPFVFGFYPAIELRYTRRLSNVDWLYQYQQHEVLFKLEKQF